MLLTPPVLFPALTSQNVCCVKGLLSQCYYKLLLVTAHTDMVPIKQYLHCQSEKFMPVERINVGGAFTIEN